MSRQVCLLICAIALLNCVFLSTGYYIKAPSMLPRIKRNNNPPPKTNIDEMGKFFLKASKSVPRIGRRNNQEAVQPNNYVNNVVSNEMERKAVYPIWETLPEQLEYQPELFASPDILELVDDAFTYDSGANNWDKSRFVRDTAKSSLAPLKVAE